ncbi:hypothetical protein S40293_05608, partial [Stachybotrys chartarum IBT 40293]
HRQHVFFQCLPSPKRRQPIPPRPLRRRPQKPPRIPPHDIPRAPPTPHIRLHAVQPPPRRRLGPKRPPRPALRHHVAHRLPSRLDRAVVQTRHAVDVPDGGLELGEVAAQVLELPHEVVCEDARGGVDGVEVWRRIPRGRRPLHLGQHVGPPRAHGGLGPKRPPEARPVEQPLQAVVAADEAVEDAGVVALRLVEERRVVRADDAFEPHIVFEEMAELLEVDAVEPEGRG